MPLQLDGKAFGLLTVIGEAAPGRNNETRWHVRCHCGTEKIVRGSKLKHNKSCGCLPKNVKHGRARTPEWHSWQGMRMRCSKPKHKDFHRYGGRGITVCDRWQSFENFFADMGLKPSPAHSIDRWPNPNGNYEPDNCRWATPRDQRLNRADRAELQAELEAM